MLKKIIAIKNVGRFVNSAASGNPQLAKYTFVSGANGYGKTTICAVLRSLQTGDASHVIGRRTLNVADEPTVEILLDGVTARFDGRAWSTTVPRIAIFDGVFIADNIHSGDVVDLEHRRNLYRVIVGEAGVKLAQEESDLAAASRAKTAEITAAKNAIQQHVPRSMRLDDFLGLPELPDVGAKIEIQQEVVSTLRQADALRSRGALTEFPLPSIPPGFTELLARTIDDIAKDAEQQVANHLEKHGMTNGGGNWIAEGLGHTGETCPFCGQGTTGVPLIAAFRAVFSEQYKALSADIAKMKSGVEQGIGAVARVRLEALAQQNIAALEFWKAHCAIPDDVLLPPSALAAIERLAAASTELLGRKAMAPLEPIAESPAYLAERAAYVKELSALEAANAAIQSVNAAITAKKAEAESGNLAAAEAELSRLNAIVTRHSEEVAELCRVYMNRAAEKAVLDRRKEEIRNQLDVHTETVVKPYERRINDYLTAFNAGFSITETRHAYPGGVATSSYQLVINNAAIDLGDGRTPVDRPSFKNTLSAGDRTTLALAFFLAGLEQEALLADTIVVFDDPFSSQDAFRRRQTVNEIVKVAGKSAQVLVLSHDATFLKHVWDKAPVAERVSLGIADHRAQGSKIIPLDIELACQGRTATDIDDLMAYLTTGAGKMLDIVRKMRVVLETFCRATYPNSFLANDWLGDIVRKIREGGAEHPAQGLYDELDQINDYTSQYHHGEDIADATPDLIDPTELTGFARRTLRIVNASQA